MKHPNLGRLLSGVLCLLIALPAFAQTPVPVQVPTPFGPNGSRFYKGVDSVTALQMDSHGVPRHFNAIMAELGTTFMVDPAKVDWSVLYRAVQYGFKSGCSLEVWRFQQDVSPYFYKNGQRVKN